MGPSCEILVDTIDRDLLETIDAILDSLGGRVISRDGREWEISIYDRPFFVSVNSDSSSIAAYAGCNDPLDWKLLKQIAMELTYGLDGLCSEIEK